MELIKSQEFGGERPLFTIHDTRLENITITDGESGIKQCQRVEASNCRFYGKYPWWHVDGALIEDCYFALDSRSAIWYTNDLVMRRCRIDAPKFFREMKNVELEDVQICDADETFWRVDGLKLRNVKLHGGTYPFMFSKNIYVDGLESDSKYVFQYCQNVEIHNAKILTKDSFWECENVTIYDSELDGEYLAWHSKNVRLVNCHLAGEQLLCYASGLVLELHHRPHVRPSVRILYRRSRHPWSRGEHQKPHLRTHRRRLYRLCHHRRERTPAQRLRHRDKR